MKILRGIKELFNSKKEKREFRKAYIFIIFTFITLLYILLSHAKPDVVIAILMISVPVYFVLALRRFYGQSYGKALLKFISVSIIYNGLLRFDLLMSFRTPWESFKST